MKTMYIYSLIERIKKKEFLNSLMTGAIKHGYNIQFISMTPNHISDDDIFVQWNSHLRQGEILKKFKKVLTCENPYVKVNDTKKWCSVGLKCHNDPVQSFKQLDSGERWESFDIELQPWKNHTKDKYLVATQAKNFNDCGLGTVNNRQPIGWDFTICSYLKSNNKQFRFRTHPNGKNANYIPEWIPLSYGHIVKDPNDDIIQSLATIVHSSNIATDSLIQGVPVIYTGETIFLKNLCTHGIMNIDNLKYEDRIPHFHHIAWNQYSYDEFESGYVLEVFENNC